MPIRHIDLKKALMSRISQFKFWLVAEIVILKKSFDAFAIVFL